MEKRKWLWKRKSSERSPGETDSSGSISSHSERFSDDQDPSKASPTDSAQSPEVTSKTTTKDEDVNDRMKGLTEKLSAALVNVSAKDDLVKQHAKVAEEAVAGWEKAENEVTALKKQLDGATQQKAALEDRVIHLDGALKECVRQLRQAREELEEKIHEAVVQKSLEWESIKSELENQFIELKAKEAAAKSESPDPIVDELCQKLEYLEQENAALKLELFSQSEELEVRTIERDLSTQAAETASKQHLESIKKVAKLEAECRRLKATSCKSSSVNDHRTSAASSIYVESLPDSQSDSGEKLNSVELDARKVSCLEPYKSEQSCTDSWASTLISELNQFKNEKSFNRNLPASPVEIDLMDDFLEMERLAALPENETGTDNSKAEAVAKKTIDAEISLRTELEVMAKRTAKLEEKLQKVEGEKFELEERLQKVEGEKFELEEKLRKVEGEKFELEEKLRKVEGEKFELEEKLQRSKEEMDELEMALNESQDRNESSQLRLSEIQQKLVELQEELLSTNESKQQIEFQLVTMEAEARTMSAKVNSMEGEIVKERVLSAEIALKYHELEEELARKNQEEELQQNLSSIGEPKIKQEDFDVAANKLAECQKTIASLGNQLKSLATLKDFLIDTASIPEFSAGAPAIPKGDEEPWKLHCNETFSPKRDSGSLRIDMEGSGPAVNKNEGDSPPSVSSSASSAVSSNHVSSEKNRNGFAKFFSRSKNGIQLEI
ncbi:FILAMENT-LIKE PLANT PROTEIN 1-RELATED [Salix viminalis]|uniref:FILAMENT-LIKE PLANT PROTEIN 1-RELATED n=1 Tax=Salix viminalis TaxID=40686 RepID=A0A9Q0UI76_SALVM|nr:FILAMENT-LIKE PLANT PROTEIN 1-RELATED [Salix viminalis]